MNFRKIQRLELVSDKIEGGDSKRKVVHIHFGCPTKKGCLGFKLSMEGQPWLEMELGGWRWELAWKRTDGGKKSRGWAASCGGQGRGVVG
jgi:hypothetical protein